MCRLNLTEEQIQTMEEMARIQDKTIDELFIEIQGHIDAGTIKIIYEAQKRLGTDPIKYIASLIKAETHGLNKD